MSAGRSGRASRARRAAPARHAPQPGMNEYDKEIDYAFLKLQSFWKI